MILTGCPAVPPKVVPDGDTAPIDTADDCNEAIASVYVGAPEYCNGIDDDCDGIVDEATAIDALTWYTDNDADTYGDPTAPQAACDAPAGTVADATDCDDVSAANHPGAAELCDGVDNDCNGEQDEATATDASAWYLDSDEDGYGAGTPLIACTGPTGYGADASDCDDTDPAVFPGADELCNGADDNCDAAVDEDTAIDAASWYADGDADGYGAGTPVLACEAPGDYLSDGADCDDADAAIHPGADELCNGGDDNCDGVFDDATAIDASTWYADADGDSFGDLASPQLACTAPADHVTDPSDCDDTDASINSAASEVCDGADNDCDAEVDESAAIDAPTWYADSDSDGLGDPDTSQVSCDAPVDYVDDDSDCDDGDASVPTAVDADCDRSELPDDCDDTNADQPDALGHCAAPYTTIWGSYLVVISPGTFTMAGGNGDPADAYLDHEVTLTRSFWLGEHEVTQDEWAGWTSAADPTPAYFTGADHPVEQVNWTTIVLYANALSAAEGLTACYDPTGTEMVAAYAADPYGCPGYRLPTEAEWEYAAGAGVDTTWSGSDAVEDVAWYSVNSGSTTQDVCTLAPNTWGLCDMSGNVLEWVNDGYDETYGGYGTGAASTDPAAPMSDNYRVHRGGCWGSGSSYARIAYRRTDPLDHTHFYYGFRLARTSLEP